MFWCFILVNLSPTCWLALMSSSRYLLWYLCCTEKMLPSLLARFEDFMSEPFSALPSLSFPAPTAMTVHKIKKRSSPPQPTEEKQACSAECLGDDEHQQQKEHSCCVRIEKIITATFMMGSVGGWTVRKTDPVYLPAKHFLTLNSISFPLIGTSAPSSI